MRQLKSLDERSHLLKHLIEKHPDLTIEEFRFGMRVRESFRSAFERQVGEAVSIKKEQERGITLMNSKSEFNRCIIPRITIDDENETLKRLREEEELERERRKKIKLYKKRKAENNDDDLKEICKRMITENNVRWKIRQKEEEERKKKEDAIEKEAWERTKRLNIAKMKKQKLLKKIEERKNSIPKKGLIWIKEKQERWRKYRSNVEIDDEEMREIQMKLLERNILS